MSVWAVVWLPTVDGTGPNFEGAGAVGAGGSGLGAGAPFLGFPAGTGLVAEMNVVIM